MTYFAISSASLEGCSWNLAEREEALGDTGGPSGLCTETFFPPPVSVVCNAQSRTVLTSLPDFEILCFFSQFIHPQCLLWFQTHGALQHKTVT